MSNARNLARVLADTSGAIAAANLANAVPADGSITTAKLAAGAVTDAKIAAVAASKVSGALAKANMASGTVLQVAQAVKTDAFSTASTSMIDVSGLSVTITPTSSTSKFLVMIDVMISAGSYVGLVNLVRNGSNLFQGDAAGSRPTPSITFGQDPSGNGISQRSSITYLDSPATGSALTYKVQASGRPDGGASGTTYINRTVQDRDTNTYDQRGASSITVLEIAA